MKSASKIFMFIIGLGFAIQSSVLYAASEQQEAIRHLTELPILLDKSTMTYDMFKLDGGNPVYNSALNRIVERIKNNTNNYKTSFNDNDEIKNNLMQLNKSVSVFLQELRSNQSEISQGGYEEYAVVDDMYEQKANAKELASVVATQIAETINVKADPLVTEGRELAALLQTITANYVEQSSSLTGRALRGGEDQNLPIDKLADTFSERLAKFNPESDKVIGLNAKIRDVKNKWAFLKGSMTNFKSDTVPYLTFHYADKMVDDLLDIVDMYENRNQEHIQAPSFTLDSDSDGAPLPFGIPPTQD